MVEVIGALITFKISLCLLKSDNISLFYFTFNGIVYVRNRSLNILSPKPTPTCVFVYMRSKGAHSVYPCRKVYDTFYVRQLSACVRNWWSVRKSFLKRNIAFTSVYENCSSQKRTISRKCTNIHENDPNNIRGEASPSGGQWGTIEVYHGYEARGISRIGRRVK